MTSQNEIVIKEYLKNDMGLPEKRVLQEYDGLKVHPDIECEFAFYIENGWDTKKSDWITIEGFTARQLHEQYPLSALGAYNYLIYLREEPKEALALLKKGLPRE